jgi:DNA invertase Pin-like site-specific DNA recombinase
MATMATKRQRAALYLRVSTDGQTTDNQRMALMETAERRGWEVVQTYEDTGISGAKGRDKRPALDAALKDATRRRYDVLMVWAIDRLGRSTAGVVAALDDLQAAGVGILALKEGMDGTTPHGRAMLDMASVFAQLERAMIRERVNAGLARARVRGKRLGRPMVSSKVEAAIRARLATGEGMLKVAKAVGVGTGTVQRVKRVMVAEAVTVKVL